VKQPELIIPEAVGVHATNQVQVAHGNWAADHDYAAADVVFDAVGSTYQVCAVTHRSGAGTFAQDVAANPLWWRVTIWTASAANLTTPGTKNWNNSIDACEALTYAGFSDWRLPNCFELSSLLDPAAAAAPMINAIFVNAMYLTPFYYWSSTTTGTNTLNAVRCAFTTTANLMAVNAKTGLMYVRPVRGGHVKA
jgi:hypothetical protein